MNKKRKLSEMNSKIFLQIIFCLILFSHGSVAQQNNIGLKLISVKKIWDKTPHNAFTDLVRFHNRWFCVFREGKKHVSQDGALRIITSLDGENGESAALITSANSDLRDAKITITPVGQLMLSGAEALNDKSDHTYQSLAWFSDDGFNWSHKYEIGDPDFWLWRTTWNDGRAYSFGYACGEKKSLRLYKSDNGKDFQILVENIGIEGYPNETSVVFKGDSAFCFLRSDGEPKTGLIGVSVPPYLKWKWKDLGVRIGGPVMMLTPDNRFLATVRLYDTDNGKSVRTSVCEVNPGTGKLTELLALPSGGDTSYAGMVLFNGYLWISYYSSHEEKTSVYLAKIAFENTGK